MFCAQYQPIHSSDNAPKSFLISTQGIFRLRAQEFNGICRIVSSKVWMCITLIRTTWKMAERRNTTDIGTILDRLTLMDGKWTCLTSQQWAGIFHYRQCQYDLTSEQSNENQKDEIECTHATYHNLWTTKIPCSNMSRMRWKKQTEEKAATKQYCTFDLNLPTLY